MSIFNKYIKDSNVNNQLRIKQFNCEKDQNQSIRFVNLQYSTIKPTLINNYNKVYNSIDSIFYDLLSRVTNYVYKFYNIFWSIMKAFKNIGIYGGAFDPVHNSHLSLILALAKMPLLDQLWLLPCGSRNDKKLLFSTDKRFSILKQLFKNDTKIKVCEQQIELSKKYGRMIPTYEFLNYLKDRYKDNKFYFVIGGDLVKDLIKWDDGQKLIVETSFIIFKRKGYEIEQDKLPPNYVFNEHQLQQMSSTNIKAIITGQANNKRQLLQGIVPPLVIQNLKEQGYI